jgi:hypothetical protein
MRLPDNRHVEFGVDELPGERGFVLVGDGAAAAAERLFGGGLEPGQAIQRQWSPDAPPVLVVMVTADRIEIRVPERWSTRLAARLGQLTAAQRFNQRVGRAIARLEAWHESDADSGTSPEELAAELRELRQLAPSGESKRAITDALEALDDGLPADVVTAALYRARGRAVAS